MWPCSSLHQTWTRLLSETLSLKISRSASHLLPVVSEMSTASLGMLILVCKPPYSTHPVFSSIGPVDLTEGNSTKLCLSDWGSNSHFQAVSPRHHLFLPWLTTYSSRISSERSRLEFTIPQQPSKGNSTEKSHSGPLTNPGMCCWGFRMAICWGNGWSYVGDLNYVPITQQSPANKYWGIDQTISYGKDNVILQSAGIVDTGTTLLLLATDVFQAYQNATGSVLDE